MKRHSSHLGGSILALALAISAFGQSPCSQTLPAGFDALDGPAAVPNPMNSNSSQKFQWIYDSAQFHVQGPITITQLWVRPATPGYSGAGGTLAGVTVTLASCPLNFSGASTILGANLGPNATVVRSGPWSTGAIVGGAGTANWISLGLTTPFTYDPSLGQDLTIQIEKCGTGTIGISLDHDNSGVNAMRYGSTASCTATSSGAPSTTVQIFRVDYTVAPPRWQVNQPGAGFSIDGGTNDACSGPIRSTKCAGATMNAALSSTNAGQGWDVVITGGSSLASTGGGAITPGGQVLNMNLGDPTLVLLQGGTFAVPFFPVTVPFSFPIAPFDVSAQLVVLDPTRVDGFSLSAANEIHIVVPGVVPGPTTDGTFVTVTPALAPLYCPTSIPFYGVNHTQMHVTTYGRVQFGSNPDPLDWSPTATEALFDNPMIGCWADFSINLSGTISITAPAPNTIRVTYANLAYYGNPTLLSNFYLEVDAATNIVTISGILSFAPFITGSNAKQMLLGISRGSPIATDPGPTAFTVGGPNPGPTNATDILYDYGTAGMFAIGVNTLVFVPNITTANYDWTALP